MPPSSIADYRRRTICYALAEGHCMRRTCTFNHHLVDPAELRWLIGVVEEEEEMRKVSEDHVYLVVEFTCASGKPDSGKWLVRICSGERVMLSRDPAFKLLSSELRYPMQAESPFLIRAVWDLAQRIFKESGVSLSLPHWESGDLAYTMCKKYEMKQPHDESKCHNRHDFIDFTDIEDKLLNSTRGSTCNSAGQCCVRFTYSLSPEAGFIWDITDRARGRAVVSESHDLSASVEALLEYLGHDYVNSELPAPLLGKSELPQHTTGSPHLPDKTHDEHLPNYSTLSGETNSPKSDGSAPTTQAFHDASDPDSAQRKVEELINSMRARPAPRTEKATAPPKGNVKEPIHATRLPSTSRDFVGVTPSAPPPPPPSAPPPPPSSAPPPPSSAPPPPSFAPPPLSPSAAATPTTSPPTKTKKQKQKKGKISEDQPKVAATVAGPASAGARGSVRPTAPLPLPLSSSPDLRVTYPAVETTAANISSTASHPMQDAAAPVSLKSNKSTAELAPLLKNSATHSAGVTSTVTQTVKPASPLPECTPVASQCRPTTTFRDTSSLPRQKIEIQHSTQAKDSPRQYAFGTTEWPISYSNRSSTPTPTTQKSTQPMASSSAYTQSNVQDSPVAGPSRLVHRSPVPAVDITRSAATRSQPAAKDEPKSLNTITYAGALHAACVFVPGCYCAMCSPKRRHLRPGHPSAVCSHPPHHRPRRGSFDEWCLTKHRDMADVQAFKDWLTRPDGRPRSNDPAIRQSLFVPSAGGSVYREECYIDWLAFHGRRLDDDDALKTWLDNPLVEDRVDDLWTTLKDLVKWALPGWIA
ncbi:hypothetical protein PHLGIDRAFT_121805 [Phlebiopsis gigantea 11061_1 CR5-6]|uniref:Uncharacterized protein n=1 Tax=Phlebiopsis gigantea (strain 11061_1 CR5-6) TaxID=745531 RepID=A0A0C3RSA3_PHLG1|nr:hypothetical protein PHLGIDRAFT_121805 [Phlebiopsis gigantea 11061_1 CR5-6]